LGIVMYWPRIIKPNPQQQVQIDAGFEAMTSKPWKVAAVEANHHAVSDSYYKFVLERDDRNDRFLYTKSDSKKMSTIIVGDTVVLIRRPITWWMNNPNDYNDSMNYEIRRVTK
ncbi:MAG: hypothetical protein WCO23_03520, partial [bacterium]